MTDELAQRIVRLETALQYAIRVIESYQLDIRNSEWVGVDLVAKGFCQGSIYRDAVEELTGGIRFGKTERSAGMVMVELLGVKSQPHGVMEQGELGGEV